MLIEVNTNETRQTGRSTSCIQRTLSLSVVGDRHIYNAMGSVEGVHGDTVAAGVIANFRASPAELDAAVERVVQLFRENVELTDGLYRPRFTLPS